MYEDDDPKPVVAASPRARPHLTCAARLVTFLAADTTKGVDVEVVNACLICLVLNQKKKILMTCVTAQLTPPVCSICTVFEFLLFLLF